VKKGDSRYIFSVDFLEICATMKSLNFPGVFRVYIQEDFYMAYKITDECISCGACSDTCPVGCIEQGDEFYKIDADECISCGACVDSCAVSAIVEE